MPIHPSPRLLAFAGKGKVVSAAEAVRLIRDGDAVATGGIVGIGFAEEIALVLEELYLSNESEAPRQGNLRTSPSSMPPVRATARTAGSITSPMRGSSSG